MKRSDENKRTDIRHNLGGFHRFPDSQNGYYGLQHILSGKRLNKGQQKKRKKSLFSEDKLKVLMTHLQRQTACSLVNEI